eukprot:CAMPEP_0114141244 /NCGR_PEP_ID=MMETSP0043_2-20121206/17809_1 /TAXON_ID=464988 /ORGANISM="Hemiselmis andersenii, Strain CCMP644" /LENGTH=66 /DNA_ID=CAMNT_0001235381 /DNA_START=258 /DNA_END=455 /DNA_ORIENTATION=+
MAGKVVLFEPSGIAFGAPVRVKVPYNTSADYGTMSLRVFRYDSATARWELKPIAAGSTGIDSATGQ